MSEIPLTTLQCNLENVTVIWLDVNIGKICDDTMQSKIALRQIINYSKTFDDADGFIDYITDIHDEKTFLIVSGKLGEQLLPLVNIQNLTQVESIYIFCTNIEKHESWAKNYKKIRGVFMDINLICEEVSKDMTSYSRKHEPPSMNLLSSNFVELTNDFKDKQEAAFMYAQLLKDLLIAMDHFDIAKKDLIEISRCQYEENIQEQVKIDEFEKDYYAEKAVWWYTRDCFIYRILNTALRTQNINVLYKFRFFIQDLHQQLRELHQEFINKISVNEATIIAYRGQCLTSEEFEKKIRNNVGGLLSINNFLSTTLDKEVALVFAQTNVENHVQILFQIEIDMTINNAPFAPINDLSSFHSEDEILFSMGTVFRIYSVIEEGDVWIINLTLTNDEDQQLKSLMNYFKTVYCNSNNLLNLGRLMLDMGEYDQGEHFYQLLLKDTTVDDPADVRSIYMHLAEIYTSKGELVKSIEYSRMSLFIVEKYFPQNIHDLSLVHSNLGQQYVKKLDNKKAKKHLQKALDLLIDTPNPDLANLAFSYNNLATVYIHEENYSKALELLEKSLEISLQSLPSNHPSIGTRYNNIATMYMFQKNYNKAIENFKIGLQIQLESLPSNHHTILDTYTILAFAYQGAGCLLEKEEMEKKANEIQQNLLPSDYETLLTHYENTGLEMFRNGHFEEALTNFNKHMELMLKVNRYNHASLIKAYLNITYTYCQLHKYVEALQNIKRVIELETTQKPVNHEKIIYLDEMRFQIEEAACVEWLKSKQKKHAHDTSSLARHEPTMDDGSGEEIYENTKGVYHRIADLYFAGRHHRITIPQQIEHIGDFSDL